ncbi:MAG: metal-dependent hydrolase [Chloroflexota bacterium]
MPSPIVHVAAGCAVYLALSRNPSAAEAGFVGTSRRRLAAAAVLALLPDLDALLGLAAGDFGRFHNNFTHSALVGLLVAATVAGSLWVSRKSNFPLWFLLCLLCYDLHILLDLFTEGRGRMLLWPLSSQRFQAPVILFYGLHWSDGFISVRHLWTALSELAFLFIAGGAGYLMRRSPLPRALLSRTTWGAGR